MFYQIIFLIFYLMLVVSCNFHCFAVCFQSFMNIAYRSTAALIKRCLKLHIAIKLSIKNKHHKFFIVLKRDSFKISLQVWRLSKIGTAGCIGVFGNFLKRFAKTPRVLWWSWILNECNLSWKIVKLPIVWGLYEKNSTS